MSSKDINVERLDETLVMYNDYVSNGLLLSSLSNKMNKPNNMTDFLSNLELLGYRGNIRYLHSSEYAGHAATALSEVGVFLRRLDRDRPEPEFDKSEKSKPYIFISHAKEDGHVAIYIKRFIEEIVSDIKPKIFCSSDGTSLRSGDDFNDVIRVALNNTDLGLSILSQSYLDSNYSLMELGYFVFTPSSEHKLLLCTLDDYSATSDLLSPVTMTQLLNLTSNNEDDISNYLDDLISILENDFGLSIESNRSSLVREYASKISIPIV